MSIPYVRWTARVVGFLVVFAGGYVLGTLDARPAEAQMGQMGQMGEMGKEMLDKAGESGGALGTAVKLGTTIDEMRTHVEELQKNLETLDTIKAALGG